MIYSVPEIERIARVGFETARKRSNKLCSVEKSNVLEVSQLWKEVVTRVHQEEYPDAELSTCTWTTRRCRSSARPRSSTPSSPATSSATSCPTPRPCSPDPSACSSAAVGTDGPGLYEPVHGSAPDIAGQDKANPLAQVLSAAMMLRYQFGEEEAAAKIEKAVSDCLDDGYRTGDIMSEGCTQVGCVKMSEILMEKIKA